MKDKGRADTVQMCSLQARPSAPLLGEHSNWSLGGEMPQKGCVLCLSKVLQEEVGSSQTACCISTLLHCNT